MQNADAAAPPLRPAPAKPAASVAVFAWAGIIAAAGGSLTFNIWHDYHSAALPLALAAIAGILPPFLSSVLAHVAVVFNSSRRAKAWVFTVTGGAMFVSAFASSKVLEPGYGLAVGVIFSLVMDAASMTCLFVLLKYYEAMAACNRWLAERAAGTAGGGENRAAGGGSGNRDAAVLEPGTEAGNPGGPAIPEPGLPAPRNREPGPQDSPEPSTGGGAAGREVTGRAGRSLEELVEAARPGAVAYYAGHGRHEPVAEVRLRLAISKVMACDVMNVLRPQIEAAASAAAGGGEAVA
jgi:hypothetical protein